nr:copper chaperone CopZ [Metabacillus flavus]
MITTLTVKGMSCEHCVKAVEGSVGKLTGVSSVKVHLNEGKADVNYAPEKVSLEEIIETIDEQGYEAAE